MMKVYIVRHGQSINNRDKLWSGWMDIPLTEKGVTDAQKAGKVLSGVEFDKIYSSDLIRARQTLETAIPDCDYETSPMLREVATGDITGKPIVPFTDEERLMMSEKGYAAFGGCDLHSLYIPSTVTYVDEQYTGYSHDMLWETGHGDFYIYTDASSLPKGWAESMLNRVVFDVSHMQKEGDFVYAVMKNGVRNVASYVGTAESVVIPADVVCIFDCAFAHTDHVREIVLRSKNTVIFMMSYDWVYYEKNIRTEVIE
jgi:hypothetical protein